MKISLITGTLNRVDELDRLFQSLQAQTHTDFEVILVDQNPDNRLDKLVATYSQHFPILHLRQKEKGLSRARNLARSYVTGDVVAFPDDDSVYPPNVLAHVSAFFENDPTWDGVVARILDIEDDKNADTFAEDEDESGVVNYWKGYAVGISHAMFFRAHVVKAVAFDEKMGVGAGTWWGSAEDSDYMFQCLHANYAVYYDATFIVRHPSPHKTHSFRELIRRRFNYGLGNGYLIGKQPLPEKFVKSTFRSGYQHALIESRRGNWQRASMFLAWGVGTSIGYGAGVRRRWKMSV